MSGPLPPALVAHGDQLRANLADLVNDKRQHDAEGCSYPDLCPGIDLDVTPGHERAALDLLRIAIVELAHTNYRTDQEGQTG